MTHRPNEELDEKCEVNLPLLKGLLNEIASEIYIENFNDQLKNNEKSYTHLDINDYEGFNDYHDITDKSGIQEQVFQLVLIDPYTIMNAFEVTDEKAKSASDGPTQEQFEAVLT